IWMYSLFWHLKNLSCKPTTQGSNLQFKSFFAFFPQNARPSTPHSSGERLFRSVFLGLVPMSEICPICEDSGLRLIIQPDGERYAQPCECRLQQQAARLLKRASIPKRYEHCTLDTFEPGYGQADQSLAMAFNTARRFVYEYPVATEGRGLLLTGSMGVGK